ncbi:class D sortase [Alkalihalobacterium elongatum]|uniref:class D sortase n=1 Tax=Alkalihalobacterium elongatum TaxID=2675466 RepID=UPI001F372A61|nr:class D sortase [Alkalihalobacterium elongatum]
MGQSLIILLFLMGLVIFLINAFGFFQGFFAVEKVPIEVLQPLPIYSVHSEQITGAIPNPKQHYINKIKPARGEQYGHLIIPKLQAKIPIFYGAEEEQLKKGIGHVGRTAFPGENNNVVLSGHRDTVFRHLGKIEKGDRFLVETNAGDFTYLVRKIRIVDKDDQTVIVPKPKETLTVITCYPFGFAGNAPKRFVIIADLVAS